jgi:hypothetical protein
MIKNLVRSLGLSAVLFVLPGVALAYCPPTRPPSLQQQCLDHEERERQQEAARARQREQEVARERQREQEAARDRQREQEAARERQQQEAARERQREQEAARAQGSARERQQQEAQEKQRKHQEAERPRITERPGGKLPSLGQGAPLAPPHAPAQQQQQQQLQQLQQPQQRYTQTVAIPGSPQPQPSNNAPTSQTTQARTGTATPTGNTSTIPNASNVSNVSTVSNTANQLTTQQRQTAPATVAPTSQSALLRQQRSAPPSPVIASASPSSLPSPASRTTPVNGVNLATGGNTTPADTSGTSSTSGTSTTTSGSGKKAEKKIVWGPLQYEAVAICRKQKRGTYQCFGPLDNEVLGGDTLERGLARQRCAGGTWAAGGPFLHDQQWEAYRCGHALGAGDYDLVKRYNLITAQRTYMCPQYKPSDGRCDTPYDGQDKR